MGTLTATLSPQARLTYLGISVIIRRQLSTTRPSCSTYQRSDFTNQPYTGIYEPGGPTEGPLHDAHTPARITPTLLKQHLDAFVVGQERAKRTLATAVYNHYQRIAELQRRDEEEDAALAQEERRRMAMNGNVYSARHPVEGTPRESDPILGRNGVRVPTALTSSWGGGEDEFPGQQQTTGSSLRERERERERLEGWGQEVVESSGRRSRGGVQGQQQQQQQQEGSTKGFTMPGQPSQHQQQQPQQSPPPPTPLFDPSPLTIEKSNILLLGPSGVGKTLMAKTLARVLEVPFSISDCTPFTQAGYIGEDAEVCVQRLLAAANYDVARAERGIVCLDEIDKIATARVSHGKDVSGEGVQQALLKIIEGTTLQVLAKGERGTAGGGAGGRSGYPTNSPLSGGGGASSGQQSSASSSGGQPQKGETYNVRTDNILFICAGAFNGLHRMILDRVGKGSIGFNATIRAAPGSSSSTNSTQHETVLEGEDELFEQNLPYYSPPTPATSPNQPHQQKGKGKSKRTYNTLDLVTPQDLQTYGLIPELVGRIPISCALASLSVPALVQVLTEPRNSLLKQYEQLFALSSVELRVTTGALHAIARAAARMGTGARALRTVMEGLLGDAMFEIPGSAVRFVLVTEGVALLRERVRVFGRAEQAGFYDVFAREEEEWEVRRRRREEDGEGEGRARNNTLGGAARTFEEYREKASAAGF